MWFCHNYMTAWFDSTYQIQVQPNSQKAGAQCLQCPAQRVAPASRRYLFAGGLEGLSCCSRKVIWQRWLLAGAKI